jgi:hypothetical protein
MLGGCCPVNLQLVAVSTDIRNVPMLTTLEMSPFRRKGNFDFS